LNGRAVEVMQEYAMLFGIPLSLGGFVVGSLLGRPRPAGLEVE
jgi:hypothetical protein